jgi:amylosucrase
MRTPGPVGLEAFSHRRFLNDYYSGRFPSSFARGALFQENEATGDARISGSAASLCGIESALASGDEHEVTLALRRLELTYAVVFSFGGIPLIYMGDELAMLNDKQWDDDLAHADDNRWMHRPPMDWAAAGRRNDAKTLESRAFSAVRRLVDARRSLLALRAGGETEIVATANNSVLAYRRVHPRSAPFLALTNFSDLTQDIDADAIARAGLHNARHVHSTTGDLSIDVGRIQLLPWGFAWFTGT